MQNSLVSIIIPTYNRAHLIGETLDSVLAQTYKNWECIVVHDGSTDFTDELLEFYCEKDSRIQYYHRPQDRPKGANACRNYGFEMCKGEYVMWLDSDDVLDKNYLQEKIELCSSKPDLVMSSYYYSSYDFKRSRVRRFDLLNENLFLAYVTDKIEVQIHSCLWNRKFLKGKLFDESLYRFQDNDFNLRMFYANPTFQFTDKKLGFVRGGVVNRISSPKNQNLRTQVDIFRYRRKCVELLASYKKRGDLNPALQKLVYKKAIWSYYQIFTYQNSLSERIKIYSKYVSTCRKIIKDSNRNSFLELFKIEFKSWMLIISRNL